MLPLADAEHLKMVHVDILYTSYDILYEVQYKK